MYVKSIDERYREEVLWKDGISKLGIYWTMVVTALNLAFFMYNKMHAEPRKMEQVVQMVQMQLQEMKKENDRVVQEQQALWNGKNNSMDKGSATEQQVVLLQQVQAQVAQEKHMLEQQQREQRIFMIAASLVGCFVVLFNVAGK